MESKVSLNMITEDYKCDALTKNERNRVLWQYRLFIYRYFITRLASCN